MRLAAAAGAAAVRHSEFESCMIAPESLRTRIFENFSDFGHGFAGEQGRRIRLSYGALLYGSDDLRLVAVASCQHTLALAPRAGHSGALQQPCMARSLKFHAIHRSFFFPLIKNVDDPQTFDPSVHFMGATSMIGCLLWKK